MDKLWTSSVSLVVRSLVVAALALLAMFFTRLYQVRTRFRAEMTKHDIVSYTQLSLPYPGRRLITS